MDTMQNACLSTTETIEKYCPSCKRKTKFNLTDLNDTLEVKGESIRYVAKSFACTTCKAIFVPTEMEEINFNEAYSIYRKKHKLLSPSDIKKLRESYGLSQKDFSRLIGAGDITIHRYEAGGLQDEIHNNLLVLLKDRRNVQSLYNRNKSNLSPKGKSQIEAILETKVSQGANIDITKPRFRFPVALPKHPALARQLPKWDYFDNYCYARG